MRRAVLDPQEWRDAITAAGTRRPLPVHARTFLRDFHTYSHPVVLACDDGREYVIKGRQAGRAIVNDQVIGRLGLVIGAPVGIVTLVNVPQELIAVEPSMQHMPSGVSHGCLWIPGCTERAWLEHALQPENRSRFALLAVLYGWVYASDHQVIYENMPPHLVHSVDHGHFLPGGPNWTVAGLWAAAAARPEGIIVQGCGLTAIDMRSACQELRKATDPVIAEAVAVPPDDWGMIMDERIALAEYLARRRDELLALRW